MTLSAPPRLRNSLGQAVCYTPLLVHWPYRLCAHMHALIGSHTLKAMCTHVCSHRFTHIYAHKHTLWHALMLWGVCVLLSLDKLSKPAELNYGAQGWWEMFHGNVSRTFLKNLPDSHSATSSISSDKYCSKKYRGKRRKPKSQGGSDGFGKGGNVYVWTSHSM